MAGILKLTLDLGFCLDHHEDLGTSFHQFRLNQHNYAARKVLTARSDQHHSLQTAALQLP